jgi:hypothetical protein
MNIPINQSINLVTTKDKMKIIVLENAEIAFTILKTNIYIKKKKYLKFVLNLQIIATIIIKMKTIDITMGTIIITTTQDKSDHNQGTSDRVEISNTQHLQKYIHINRHMGLIFLKKLHKFTFGKTILS